MHTTVKPCKNTTAAANGWTIKFGEPSSFDLANGSTSWISVFRALFITSQWLVCHTVKIGSNATDALIEDIRVEAFKFQRPSFRTYAKINCRIIRVANLRDYMFMLLRVTADLSLKLTIRGMPQEHLNKIILFPTPSTSSLTVPRRSLIFI